MERSVTFIRHGQAVPAPDGRDVYRVLTGIGRRQSTERAGNLRSHGLWDFRMVCSSIAERTLDTAEVISGWNRWHIRRIPDMYPDPKIGDGMVIDRMFTQLGYAPLREYFAHQNADVIRAHGAQVWRQLQRRIVKARSALVTGHAVLLPATAWAACSPHGKFIEELESCNLGEAEGFTIKFDDWKPVEFIPHR